MSLGYIGENIPAEWVQPLLTDLVNPKQWKTIPTKDLLEEGYVVYGANGKIGFYNEFTHENPTLMITCRGATCGNLHISEPYSYINGNAMALDRQQVELIGVNFLRYALEARGLTDTISGSAQPQITRQGLSKVRIPLPPLAEQKVIADKLETMLAQVETTKARLERIPEILKTFRQSILAAAVSGKLTEGWREENDVSIEQWLSTTVGALAEVATGKTPKRTTVKYWEGGSIPWLTSAATGKAFTYKSEQFVTKQAVIECSLKVFPAGTLLLAMYGEGKTRGQVTEIQLDATCNQACAAILVDDAKVSKEFLKIRLQENYEETRKAAVGGAQPNLNLSKVREIPVALPTESEQFEIVRRVEELFAFADNIEAKNNTALLRVNKITQSILEKAFRGELTADWREANPDLITGKNSAESLLKKITAEQQKLRANKTRKR